jgi:predicted AlkP superfamily phosphohydrolase/phosphomutase
VFLNLRGREARGIVRRGEEADRVAGRVAETLASLKDPKTGSHVIRNVYRRDDIYSGACAGEAPELVAGFEPGYRASWQTAIGGAPPRILEDNTKAWSGDHFVDAPCVPGIFLMNRPVSADRPDARDIGPTVLDYLGVPPAADMEGRSLLEPQP